MNEDIYKKLLKAQKETQDIDKEDIYFTNVVYLNRQNPKFHKLRGNRKFEVNDVVRLEFKNTLNNYSEKMWLKIIDKRPDGLITGILQSNPVLFLKLKYNQPFNFLPEHVIE